MFDYNNGTDWPWTLSRLAALIKQYNGVVESVSTHDFPMPPEHMIFDYQEFKKWLDLRKQEKKARSEEEHKQSARTARRR